MSQHHNIQPCVQIIKMQPMFSPGLQPSVYDSNIDLSVDIYGEMM
jgi:hypothetical protein